MELTPGWYALYTRSRAEKAVHDELNKKGVEAFLPMTRRLRQWKDRKKWVDFPLFPGYLFIQIVPSPEERVRVLKVKGAVHILGLNPHTPIPDPEIESIRRLLEHPELLDPHPFLEVGRRVRVVRGPFIGVEGILLEKRKKSRLVVAVSLLKQAVSTEVDADDVEAV